MPGLGGPSGLKDLQDCIRLFKLIRILYIILIHRTFWLISDTLPLLVFNFGILVRTLAPTPSLLEIAYAVAVVRCGTFLVLTRSLFFIFLELNLSLQVC